MTIEELMGLPAEGLLTSVDVGDLFKVDPKTVARWALAGRIASIKTPGGHHRFKAGVVRRALEEGMTGG